MADGSTMPGMKGTGPRLSKMGYADGEPRWHLICCNRKQERLARWHLERLKHEVWLPLRLINNRDHVHAVPFFPGYLFVRVASDAEWRDIFTAIGVRSVVSDSGRPASLPKATVELLRRREVNGYLEFVDRNQVPCPHDKGDRVSVSLGDRGAELEAIFISRVDATRCRLLISLCGRDSEQVVSLAQVS